MNAIKRLIFTSSIGALLCYSASAQDSAQIRFSAACRTLNGAGNIVRKNISNQTLIRECATDNNVTNRHPLELVYHFNGDQNGDTIEVVNRKTDAVVCTKFKLLFPMEMISNDDGSETVQLLKVFGDQQSEEIGTAVVRKTTNAKGKVRVSGSINYFMLGDSETNSPSICTGTFNSGSTASSSSISLPDFSGFGGMDNNQ
jgi:hypothetical protein